MEMVQEGSTIMEPDNKQPHPVRSVWHWGIGTGIAAIVAFFPINKAYDDYHVRLAKDAVSTELVHLQQSIEETQETGVKSANQIDFLVKAEAARMVDALTTKLVLLRSQHSTTPEITRDIHETEVRLQKATVYRNCVIDEHPNCDALRVW